MLVHPNPVRQNYVSPMAKYKRTNTDLKKIPKVRSSKDRWYHDRENRKVLYVLGGSLACVVFVGAAFAIPIVLTTLLNQTTTTIATKSTLSTTVITSVSSTNTLNMTATTTALNMTATTTTLNMTATTTTLNMTATTTATIATVTQTTTTVITCSNMTCTFSPIISLMSSTNGVEHLDINCTQSLSNLTIEIIVQRTVNASYANQYQTFSNITTNQTYIETNSEIIYTWTLLPGQMINDTGFPYYVEAEYNLQNINQTTNLDTFSVTLTSVCGHVVSQNGTF